MVAGAGDRVDPRRGAIGMFAAQRRSVEFRCGLVDMAGNFPAAASFATQMKSVQETDRAPELNALDRKVIRVDLPPAHAGITAALRRAFEAAATEPSDVDFNEFLRKLN